MAIRPKEMLLKEYFIFKLIAFLYLLAIGNRKHLATDKENIVVTYFITFSKK